MQMARLFGFMMGGVGLVTVSCAEAGKGRAQVDSGGPRVEDTDGADTSAPPVAAPTFVLAGGGSEGEVGDAGAWSARLYGHLLDGGDVTGDGQVRVVVLSTAEETDWLPSYFVDLGADGAENLRVASRDAAEEAGERVDTADAVFLKGGDQGEYYDLWNDTALEGALRGLVARGGGLGGTSAGAMSQGALALAGGEDLVSADVLEDACTAYLDDRDGGSGLKTDFFDFVPALVDTHFVERARLGRLAGALARAVDEGQAEAPLGIGIEVQTGLWIHQGRAEVIGEGSVTLLHTDGAPAPTRDCGAPLDWRGLGLDRLIEGLGFELADPRSVSGALALESIPALGAIEAEPGFGARSDDNSDEESFSWVVERAPDPYGGHSGGGAARLLGAAGLLEAQDRDRRAANDEALFQALAEGGLGIGILADGQSALGVEGGRLTVSATGERPQSALVIDVRENRGVAVGAAASVHDAGDGGLRPAAILGATVDLVGLGEGLSLD